MMHPTSPPLSVVHSPFVGRLAAEGDLVKAAGRGTINVEFKAVSAAEAVAMGGKNAGTLATFDGRQVLLEGVDVADASADWFIVGG